MRRAGKLAVLLTIGMAGALSAQVPEWVVQVINAAGLPVSAAAARNEGVPDSEVRAVLDAIRGANVPAHEAKIILDTARAVRRQHGPVDNFGAFVQTKLASGLRGRQLAAAIRAEHAARGKGKGPAAGAPGRGRDDAAAKAPARGGSNRADTAAKSPPAKGKGAPATKRPPARPNSGGN